MIAKAKALAVFFFFGFFTGILVGKVIDVTEDTEYWQHEAFIHGAAHYDAHTAAFTWNNPVTPAER